MIRKHLLLDPSKTGKDATALEKGLKGRVVGQDEAIRDIVEVYQTYIAGMSSPGRPVGSFLFLGPTGSGKTRMVEAMAETLIGDPRAVIKIDCGEFQHSHEIAKLIGSPPGYLGHRETRPLLSQETLDERQTEQVRLSFVLFDEVEKASDALWNLLLGILDKATLTLGDNRRVDFSRTIVFLTGNLGAAEMSDIFSPRMGFAPRTAEDPEKSGKIARAGIAAARRKFTPEFMNRIDKVVAFHPLGERELRSVLDIEIGLVRDRIVQSSVRPFKFHLTPAAKDFLLAEGTDPKYGARHLKRSIERNLVHPLANLVATGQAPEGARIEVDYTGGFRLQFYAVQANVPESGEMSAAA